MKNKELVLPRSERRVVLQDRTVADDLWAAEQEQDAAKEFRKKGHDEKLASVAYSIAILQRSVVELDGEKYEPPASMISQRTLREMVNVDFEFLAAQYMEWIAEDKDKCEHCGGVVWREPERPFDE
jgi:hypothetical protein